MSPNSDESFEYLRREAARDRERFLESMQKYEGPERRMAASREARIWKGIAIFLSGILLAVVPLLALQLMNFTPRSELNEKFSEVQKSQQQQSQAVSDLTAKMSVLTQQVTDLKELYQGRYRK